MKTKNKNQKWIYARTIVEENGISDKIDGYKKTFPRFGEAYEALKWLLARNCDEMDALRARGNESVYYLYRQASDNMAKTPAIVVLFTCNENEVIIIGVKAEKPG